MFDECDEIFINRYDEKIKFKDTTRNEIYGLFNSKNQDIYKEELMICMLMIF